MSSVTYEVAKGPRATRTVETIDAVEPELVTFVRASARSLDPSFPQSGTRGPKARGQWKDDDQVPTLMQQVEELDTQGRGIRMIRTVTTRTPGEPHEGAVRVIAVGLPNGARLEIWWDIILSATEVRGTSIELTVAGEGKQKCIADFHDWFGVMPAERG